MDVREELEILAVPFRVGRDGAGAGWGKCPHLVHWASHLHLEA